MRGLWVDTVAEAAPAGKEFLYLTLAGAEGRDIQALIDAGVIERLETPAISVSDSTKVVAIESKAEAEAELQGRFPGLLVKRMGVESLIHSHNVVSWPTGQDRELCRAKVMNLDLNQPLKVDIDDGQMVFPQILWIKKLAEMHARPPRIEWTLMLTLHAQIEWPEEIERRVKALLAENFEGSQDFADAAGRLLGQPTVNALASQSEKLVLSKLSKRQQQTLLMTLVPKKIAQSLRETGWKLVTRRNMRYGGTNRRAPMISFIFDFVWDATSSEQPDRIYREAILAAIVDAEHIDTDGKISAIAD